MKKITRILLVMGILLSVTACSLSNADSTQDLTQEAGSEITSTSVETSEDLVFCDQSTSSASADAATASGVELNEDPSDYDWNTDDEILITLADNAINSESNNVTVSGSTVSIEAPGSYRISGSLSNGQVIVSTEQDGVVRLILDGVDIHNNTNSAIYVENAEKVVVYLVANTENYLSDGSSYILTDSESNEPNATLFSKSDLTIDGAGALMVTGNYNDAIASKDGLIINAGNLTIVASDDGLRGKDYVLIRSANLPLMRMAMVLNPMRPRILPKAGSSSNPGRGIFGQEWMPLTLKPL